MLSSNALHQIASQHITAHRNATQRIVLYSAVQCILRMHGMSFGAQLKADTGTKTSLIPAAASLWTRWTLCSHYVCFQLFLCYFVVTSNERSQLAVPRQKKPTFVWTLIENVLNKFCPTSSERQGTPEAGQVKGVVGQPGGHTWKDLSTPVASLGIKGLPGVSLVRGIYSSRLSLA